MRAYDVLDAEGYPVMYVRGTMTDNWSVREDYRMTRSGSTYSITLSHLDGEFKVSGTEWQLNYGAAGSDKLSISDSKSFNIAPGGTNLVADNLNNVTIKFDFVRDENGSLANSVMYISANGNPAPDPDKITSGTLPVLYINVMTDDGSAYNNEIIDRNLGHKNYFTGSYWLDINGCEYFTSKGIESVGSKDSPLPLQIKARGNYTRTAFAKKPFKLKLDKNSRCLVCQKVNTMPSLPMQTTTSVICAIL